MLSARPLREADMIFSVLTRDLGLIRATASGVRREASKLRGALTPPSLANVSFVKGKEYWRITGAAQTISFARAFEGKKRLQKTFAKVFLLLETLVQGELKHPELFDDIEKVINYVINHDLEDERAETVEVLLALRIVHDLGYIKESVPQEFLSGEISVGLLDKLEASKPKLVKAINEGIKSSQLSV